MLGFPCLCFLFIEFGNLDGKFRKVQIFLARFIILFLALDFLLTAYYAPLENNRQATAGDLSKPRLELHGEGNIAICQLNIVTM